MWVGVLGQVVDDGPPTKVSEPGLAIIRYFTFCALYLDFDSE